MASGPPYKSERTWIFYAILLTFALISQQPFKVASSNLKSQKSDYIECDRSPSVVSLTKGFLCLSNMIGGLMASLAT